MLPFDLRRALVRPGLRRPRRDRHLGREQEVAALEELEDLAVEDASGEERPGVVDRRDAAREVDHLHQARLDPLGPLSGAIDLAGGDLDLVDHAVEVGRIGPAGGALLDAGAQLREAPRRRRRDPADLGIHGGVAQVGAPDDAEPFEVAVAGREVVLGGRVDRQGIARVGPGHGLEQEGGVPHGAAGGPSVPTGSRSGRRGRRPNCRAADHAGEP